MSARLSVAIVTYDPDAALLRRVMHSLDESLRNARSAGVLGEARVFLIDNGPEGADALLRDIAARWPADGGVVEVISGHGNLGYGRANNLVLDRLDSDAHLVMNPDVVLEAEALAAALATLRDHPDVALVAPAVRGDDGAPQFLCRRYPSAWVLFLRGFAPRVLREAFARRLAEYEMRDVLGDELVKGIALASGCFMLMRTAAFHRAGGFDPRYFMYFEDYDLSLRLAPQGAIAYEPRARIVHHGGEAARKGFRHVAWFIASARRFFASHGWRWL